MFRCISDAEHRAHLAGMIPGFHDPALGPGAPLAELAAARHMLLAHLTGHWSATAPARIARCARELVDRGVPGSTRARVFLVPGRIEVLGKHTDYAGGRSLIAAVERGFVFLATPRTDRIVRIAAPGAAAAPTQFTASSDLHVKPGWVNYPMTVARRLARDFPGACPGAEISLDSDLPTASGMSSSSALVVGTFFCLASVGGLASDPRFIDVVGGPNELAAYLAAVESGQGFGRMPGDAGVGTHGGSEDHTAMIRAEPGRLLQYRFVPPVLERTVIVPSDHRFVIAVCGVAAEKTGAIRDRYNRASGLVGSLHDLWHLAGGRVTPSLGAAVRSGPDALDRLKQAVRHAERPDFPVRDLLTRLDHFVQESEVLVPAGADALAKGQLREFGALVDDSQRLADELLGNQIPETVELARSARRLGAVAASSFGAGFGGSVWALVDASRAVDFRCAWQREYAGSFPGAAERATFLDSSAGPPAMRVM